MFLGMSVQRLELDTVCSPTERPRIEDPRNTRRQEKVSQCWQASLSVFGFRIAAKACLAAFIFIRYSRPAADAFGSLLPHRQAAPALRPRAPTAGALGSQVQ